MMSKMLLQNADISKDEQLIALVEKHPVLYTQSHPKYMDTKYKLKIWNTIGAFMEEETLACKARWYNIRDNYRKTLRTSYTRSGNRRSKQYKYASNLSFLDSYAEEVKRAHTTVNMDDLDTRSSSPSPTPPDEPPIEAPTAGSEHEDYIDDIVMKNEINEVEMAKDPLKSSTFDTTAETAGIQPTIRTVQRPSLKRGDIVEIAPLSGFATGSESSDRILEMLVKKVVATDSPDPVDAFLAGLAPTMKSLHPYYRNLVKTEIFAVVQKYELKMLTEPLPLIFSNQPSEA
ncbi:uncharacterized protein LOC134226531 [Armigeres subalbatus]|uniref:uncharacterized protein LOC134226531 n=1 Tax=Armigeres subalbatus TaxID=124917 RepID=UPI002ED4361D